MFQAKAFENLQKEALFRYSEVLNLPIEKLKTIE
jgi:hypothetical protein